MIPNLNNLIHGKYLKQKRSGAYILEERSEPTFPKTKIRTSGQVLLYKFDETGLLPFFQDVPKAKSISDYVFFLLNQDKVYVFITELTTTKYKTYQRDSTKYFVEYIEKTVKRLCSHTHEFKYRYILVAKNLTQKKTTKPSNSLHTSIILKAGDEINLSNYCIS